MKTLRLPSFIFLSLLFLGVHPEFKNDTDKSAFKIGPEEQRLVINVGGGVIFQLIDLDGCQSVRIEARNFLDGDSWTTIDGFENITSAGTYVKNTMEIQLILGIGVFLWRITDNNNPNHSSETKLLVIVLL